MLTTAAAAMKSVTVVIQILCINIIGYTYVQPAAAGTLETHYNRNYPSDEALQRYGVAGGNGGGGEASALQNSLTRQQQHQQKQQQQQQQQHHQRQRQQLQISQNQLQQVASSSSDGGAPGGRSSASSSSSSAVLSSEREFDINRNNNNNDERNGGDDANNGDNGDEDPRYAHGGTGGELIHNNALNRGPSFDPSATRNVTALVGKTAYLNCRIRNLGNKTVTWIRHRDLHLLTVDKATYTSDQRFVSVHNAQMGDWTLQVRYPQRRDSGVYECQVSTTPPVGYSMTLSVVEPITTIHGSPDLYIDTGSTVNLTCIVRHLPEPPAAIQWTHNNEEINYDSARGGVSVITEKGEITTSYLLIQRARISDSGKYTCLPTHANPQTVTVHVLNGEEPAAIQRGSHLSGARSLWVAVFLWLLVRVLRNEPKR